MGKNHRQTQLQKVCKKSWCIDRLQRYHRFTYTYFQQLRYCHDVRANGRCFQYRSGNNEYGIAREALKGVKAVYKTEPHASNNPGEATGRLIGGNPTMFVNRIGTALILKQGIIFSSWKMWANTCIISTGCFITWKEMVSFKKPAGLIIGGFTDLKDMERPFGKTVYEIIHDISSQLNCPVCFNFPVSHEKENLAP